MIRATMLGSAAAAAALAATTAAAAPIPLPAVTVQLTLAPPFATPVTGAENEGAVLRFPIDSAQRVTVRVDESGKPIAVRVRQRMVLRGTGDYSFVIGAPVEDVEAAPGSESEPGLRNGAVLWAGFSPGRKVLAADALLASREAAPVLPLRIEVSRADDAVRVRLRNATRVTLRSVAGNARPADAARALDQVRRRADDPRADAVILNFVGDPHGARTTVVAPLSVRGELEFPAGALQGTSVQGGTARGDTVHVDTVLGDDTPTLQDVLVRGTDALPKLRLVVTPVAPVRLLEPPSGATWQEYVRGRRTSGRELVSRAVAARLAFARARQYQTFLFDPDPLGPREATYRYVTGKRQTATPQPTATGSDGSPWLPYLLVPLAVAGVVGLVVLWAHS
jgi:hypothetical protein